MAQHKWRTRVELAARYEAVGLNSPPLGMIPEHVCDCCGAMLNLREGDELPADGCLDLDGGALPA